MVRSYDLLDVFTTEDGSFGNPLAVFLDGPGVPPEERQQVAAALGYSETVFVDDAAAGSVRIFTPAHELPLAGHPLVGSAWLIAHVHGSCELLRPPAGEVPTWQQGELRWIRANPAPSTIVQLRQYGSAAEIDRLAGAPDGLGFVACWAWVDEQSGEVRSRVFVPDQGIPEDEATGLAAIRMVAELGRVLEIRQGKGSLLHARPGPDGTAEVGGRVVHRGERSYDG